MTLAIYIMHLTVESVTLNALSPPHFRCLSLNKSIWCHQLLGTICSAVDLVFEDASLAIVGHDICQRKVDTKPSVDIAQNTDCK